MGIAADEAERVVEIVGRRHGVGVVPHGVPPVHAAWKFLRWPLGLLLLALAITLLLRWCPRRVQPHLSWLAFGTGVAVLLWGASTAGLAVFYRSSSSFGATYGPLAGLVALLVWSLLSSISLFFGAAVAAQLEAVRAGAPRPQDGATVEEAAPEGALR